MWVGAGLCVAIGVWPEGVVELVRPVAEGLSGPAELRDLGSLPSITRAAIVFVAVVLALFLVRRALARRYAVETVPTWGCGYAAPNARMQYTAASFAEPLLAPFTMILPMHVKHEPATGFFPTHAHYEEHRGDMAGEQMLEPAAHWFVRMFSRLRVPEGGRVQLYLAYVFVTLVALLLWQLGGGAAG
jgi:hydrogenase-4 component B